MNFKQIKSNYDRGLWSEAMVRVAVRKGIITSGEASFILDGTQIEVSAESDGQ